ncbi:MAG: TIGR01440 family protein [Acidaminococcaceae bacterium]
MSIRQPQTELLEAVTELCTVATPRPGQVLVVGCSTSEVIGNTIGTAGSAKVAQDLLGVLQQVTAQQGLYLAIQCCEHLNRSLVVERTAAERYGWEEVTVQPVLHAGGALGTVAYQTFADPVVVAEVTAHLGLDIGQTLIGMHLKKVAVPVRLAQKTIGQAQLTAARTRPPLVGGQRAVYPGKIK